MTYKSARKLLYAAALVGGTLLQASPAFAQATRTWVSGLGDDANPCSRTAPCKTFAGAISKTAAGGEINCIDPGGFGAVTITKSMTIDCHYTEGGVLAGGNGITVNAASTDVVVLRGLDIFGVNPPSNGVRILSAQAVHIEDCVIRRFNVANSFGISFQPSVTTNLYVVNTNITENGTSASGGGILVAPTGTGVARFVIRDTRVQHNGRNGISITMAAGVGSGIAGVIDHSDISGTAGDGVSSVTTGAPGIDIMLTNSSIANNSLNGVVASGAPVTIRTGNTSITGNGFSGGVGVVAIGGGKVLTYGDNRLDANASPSSFTGPVTKQ